MESLVINGGIPLFGEVEVSGSKNATLPIMAAALLTDEPCVISNVPDLSDVNFMGRILTTLGAHVEREGDMIRIHARNPRGIGDYNLVRKMRGSVCILGPLLARLKSARVSMPGGCVIGTRPINLHLKGMKALGADVSIEGGYICASTRRLRGTELFLGGRSGPTVLGTANVMMAATLAEGETVIDSAACEPEIIDLANFLNKMGARIEGAGSPTIRIKGVESLHGAEYSVIPDRIEAITYAIAAAGTGGEVTLKNLRPEHITAVIDKMREAGVSMERNNGALTIRRTGELSPVDVTTLPYAGFPTDVQAQMMVLMTLAPGISIITERIFESRFMHVNELARLGADISQEGPSAIVKGGLPLSGAEVMASDLRASAALVIAGLVASGSTKVNRIYHIDRGYERLDKKLQKIGARIKRVQENNRSD
ncbi:MAG: UDP-N-acetylglucosamine 1-carboxyvinyltransferase [Verrucomicrobia bacterium]|nr:UDP-N-acetylglucosamine 1-carboxyvinyltransferase [Verrucomicrobiota bacterium]MCF7707703.1 UDP-N-acetylglucosamine 1-carboxyvinyltransferase [Verrucomicrobiota bacterium]